MMRKTLVSLTVVLAAFAVTARAADLEKAKKLLRIGDYAAALVELHELVQADPENPELRFLMAKTFGECAYELKMPGTVTIGQSNADRAGYELGILLKLGEPGKKLFLGAIEGPDNRLASLAIQVANREKLADAVAPLTRLLEREGTDRSLTLSAIPVLVQLAGPRAADTVIKVLERDAADQNILTVCLNGLGPLRAPGAADAIKKLVDKEADEGRRRWLLSFYLNSLDEPGLLKLAETTTDPLVLQQFGFGFPRRVPESVWTILAKRTDLDASRRREALGRLSRVKESDKKAYSALLLSLLEDKSPDMVWAAAEQLASLEPDRAVKPLVAALADKKNAGEALRLLGEIKSKDAVEPLLRVLEDRTDPKKYKNWVVNRDQVYWTLTRLGAEGPLLVRAVRLMFEPDPALADSGTLRPPRRTFDLPHVPRERLAPVLADLLADPNVDLRRAAARQLSNLETKEAPELSLKALEDKDQDVRRLAERVVLQHARNGFIKPEKLLPLLNSEDTWVLQNAISILAAQPDKGASQSMLDLLKDEKRAPSLFRELLTFFAAIPDERAVQPIVSAVLNEQQPAPAEQAAAALKKCAAKNLPAVAKQIARGLASAQSHIRTNSAVVLKLLGDESVLPDLVIAKDKAQSPYERRIFDDAIRALAEQK